MKNKSQREKKKQTSIFISSSLEPERDFLSCAALWLRQDMIHCLGSCLIIILKNIGNAIRFAEHLLIFHNTALCLLLKILPVSSAPGAQGQCKADWALCKIQFLSPCSSIVSLSFLFIRTFPTLLWVSGENQAINSGSFFSIICLYPAVWPQSGCWIAL